MRVVDFTDRPFAPTLFGKGLEFMRIYALIRRCIKIEGRATEYSVIGDCMTDNNAAEQDILPKGTLISERYEIESCLGTGGMGCVYRAMDRVLENRKVALKILHKDIARDKALEKRFLREVQLMHSVNHPNVVRTFDVGRDEGVLYFTMEFIEGTSLYNIVNSGAQLDVQRVAGLAVQICQGLEAIHAADIVHRDLKPANILVAAKDQIKITDFGVARPKSSELTQHTEMLGSVDYMAPEVWQGKPLTRSVDLYSLGIILYQLVTGKLPFRSDQPASLMWMHIKEAPTPPKSLRPDLPNWINQLIIKLIAKSPAERPDSLKEVISFIQGHLERSKISAAPPIGIFPAAGADVTPQSDPRTLIQSAPPESRRAGTGQAERLARALEFPLPLSLVFLWTCVLAYLCKVSYAFLSGLFLL